MIPSPFVQDMHHTRLVILMEEKPFSNKYCQLELTKEQFNAISIAIAQQHPLSSTPAQPGMTTRMIRLSDRSFTLPDDITDYYTPKTTPPGVV